MEDLHSMVTTKPSRNLYLEETGFLKSSSIQFFFGKNYFSLGGSAWIAKKVEGGEAAATRSVQ